ncbi:MAG TPA: hypothetical protein VKR06_37480 [Ktedonosporobacter sp.]|nr:hypothetical protein [Ktedonosporobacter sp.]
MNDLSGLALLGEKFDDFRLTFVHGMQEQDILSRFGGNPSLAWTLPLGEYDTLDDLLYDVDDALFQEAEEEFVLQIGECPDWAFALEALWPRVPTQQLLAVISSGTTAVSVERISSKWLICLDWAENGVWKGGGEACGPFLPPLQAMIEQAGVDLEDDDSTLGKSLFAPVLSSAFGIRLTRAVLEKPLLTGPVCFPPDKKR